jgi:hypothetical protein
MQAHVPILTACRVCLQALQTEIRKSMPKNTTQGKCSARLCMKHSGDLSAGCRWPTWCLMLSIANTFPWRALRSAQKSFLSRFGARAFYYLEDGSERLQRCSAEELDDERCQYCSMGSQYAGGALTELEKRFVQSCLALDPAKRLTAEQLLEHAYLAGV